MKCLHARYAWNSSTVLTAMSSTYLLHFGDRTIYFNLFWNIVRFYSALDFIIFFCEFNSGKTNFVCMAVFVWNFYLWINVFHLNVYLHASSVHSLVSVFLSMLLFSVAPRDDDMMMSLLSSSSSSSSSSIWRLSNVKSLQKCPF